MSFSNSADRDIGLLTKEDAEIAVLGLVLHSPDKRLHLIAGDMFVSADGQALWKAIDSLAASGAPVCDRTASAIADLELVQRALLADYTPDIGYDISQLKAFRALRAAHRALEGGLDRVFSLALKAQKYPVGGDIQQFLASLGGDIAAAQAGLNEGSRITTADLARSLIEEMERADKGEQTGVIPTGFLRLDSMLNGGLQPGELIVPAARTGVGKTALALAICRHALKAGRSIFYANRELTPESMRDRLLSAEAGFAFRAGNGAKGLSPAQGKSLTVAAAAFKKWKLNVRSDIRTISGVMGEARQTRPDLVVIDHVSAFGDCTGRKSASLYDIVTHNSNACRDMALDLNVPVIGLSQLNRAAADNEEPGLHHLKQSGSLEEDARVVLLLHRAEVVSKTLQRMNATVAKNSHGSTGRVALDFNPQRQTFEESEPQLQDDDFNP